jgi:hypothetical protein
MRAVAACNVLLIAEQMSVVNLTIEAATNVVRRMQAGIATIISPGTSSLPFTSISKAHSIPSRAMYHTASCKAVDTAVL